MYIDTSYYSDIWLLSVLINGLLTCIYAVIQG